MIGRTRQISELSCHGHRRFLTTGVLLTAALLGVTAKWLHAKDLSETIANCQQMLQGPGVSSQSGCSESQKRSEAGTTSFVAKTFRDNVVAWCVVPFDSRMRSPEERAQMLRGLGFKHFAYDWRETDIPSFDAEIEALKRNGVDLLAWWFPLDADDPKAKMILETFRRHHVHPQLWVAPIPATFPKTPEEWAKLFPPGMAIPSSEQQIGRMSEEERAEITRQTHELLARLQRGTLTNSPQEQQLRVQQEADRIRAIVKLAAPYGSKVALYNHGGWFGMMQNQLAIIQRLQELGVSDVGIVYNFSHSRDELHDDTVDFPAIWQRIKPHVVAVNITGTYFEGQLIYPSQGDRELDMLRTIVASGWQGPIGVIAEKGGDAEVTLRNYLIGLDWLAAEVEKPGSGGAPPFPPVR